jgi:hypothetical protein
VENQSSEITGSGHGSFCSNRCRWASITRREDASKAKEALHENSNLKGSAGEGSETGCLQPEEETETGRQGIQKIKDSIEEFGFADPLVVNSDMTIIGGHQRLTVAMDLGYTEVPCAVVDVDKVREKALNIALNKITGSWDEAMLADLLADIQNSDFDLGKTGFEPPEIEQLFNKVHDKEVKEDNFDVDKELRSRP